MLLNNGLRKFRNSHAVRHATYNGYRRASRLMAYKSPKNHPPSITLLVI